MTRSLHSSPFALYYITIFTESAYWADSVYMLRCVSVCVSATCTVYTPRNSLKGVTGGGQVADTQTDTHRDL